MARPYRERISSAAAEKKSRLVLALDPSPSVADPGQFAQEMISRLRDQICAVKINFHLVLPLSGKEIEAITRLAHSHGLQCIADLKLNDIENTNEVAVEHLVDRMGFDAVIANPFIGSAALETMAEKARSLGGGVIALAYMSHPGAVEGFGLKLEGGREMYRLFLERAEKARADGIVVGAGRLPVIKGLSGEMPVYAPGIGAQGGDPEEAVRNGADYLIVGRSVIGAKDPTGTASEINKKLLLLVRD